MNKVYKIKTFRGFDYAETYDDAMKKAKTMIMEIIVDGHVELAWWADIRECFTDSRVVLVTCPRVGLWQFIRPAKVRAS